MLAPRTSLAFPRAAAAVLATVLAAGLTACQASNWRPTVGVNYAVVEDFDAEVSGGGTTLSGETDYESIELMVGATAVEAVSLRRSRLEARVGRAEFEDVDAVEFAAGGRVFLGGEVLAPYVSVLGVVTAFDDVSGVELGDQSGARVGVGLEIEATENLFFDVGVDYTIPVVAAETDDDVETEVEGFALRIGLGFLF